jgi:hypothetical protein
MQWKRDIASSLMETACLFSRIMLHQNARALKTFVVAGAQSQLTCPRAAK